jgi:hypothetical protein
MTRRVFWALLAFATPAVGLAATEPALPLFVDSIQVIDEVSFLVRFTVGDIEIHAGDRDLTVKMGIGDLTVHVPAERVASVRAATRIGDASLRGTVHGTGRRRMLVGARVAWHEGTGPSHIDVGLKIGDASVVLE